MTTETDKNTSFKLRLRVKESLLAIICRAYWGSYIRSTESTIELKSIYVLYSLSATAYQTAKK